MRRILFLLITVLSLHQQAISASAPTQGFIPNAGQWPAQVRYRLSIPGGALFVRNEGLTYVMYDAQAVANMHEAAHDTSVHITSPNIRQQGIHMNLRNAHMTSTPIPQSGSTTRYNYYKGSDPSKWASNLQAWKEVLMPNVYPGIDWKLSYGELGTKYDFIVAANTNPQQIRMDFTGANSVELRNNTLYINTEFGEIVEQAPVAWQDLSSGRMAVTCQFMQYQDGSIGFDLGNFDSTQPLVIDPALVFASYSGSTDDNWGYTATYDNFGNAYSGGIVFGANFATTAGVFEETFGGGQLDIGILKYTPDGSSALYITYIGGNSMELPHSMMVNEYDELLIFGTTGSTDFPTTSGAFSNQFQGGPNTTFENGYIQIPNGIDIFVLRLSADGSNLLASTYVGGTGNDGFNGNTTLVKNYADEIRGALWVDANNNVYVGTSTSSTDFPVSSDAIQSTIGGGGQDGVVIKLNGNLSQLLWSTYLGGSQADGIFYLVVDEAERVIVTGGTASNNFPVSSGAFQGTYGGGTTDGFISIIDSSGTNLIASTYIGSNVYDQSFIVGADKTDHVYIFGQTSHTGSQFNVNTAIGVTGGNQFLMKLDPELTEVIWSTAFGNASGQPDISPTALLVDFCDKIYCTGWGGAVNSLGTTTFGLPTTPDAYRSTTDGSDFYLLVIDNQAQEMLYASFLGGTSSPDHVDGGTSRFDRKGVIYQSICAGCGGQSDFPITTPVHSATNNAGNCNNLLAKFDFESPITVSAIATLVQPLGCAPYTAELSNTSINADVFSWRINDQEIATTQDLSYTFNESGTFEIVLIASSSVSCNGADTVSITVNVLEDITGELLPITTCAGFEIAIGPDNFDDPYYQFNWSPSTGLSDPNVRKPLVSPLVSTTYDVIIRVGTCVDTLTQELIVYDGTRSSLPEINACALTATEIGLEAPLASTVTYLWSPTTGLSSSTIYNPVADISETTDYLLIATLGPNCRDTIDQRLIAIYDQMNAGPDLQICSGTIVNIGLPDVSGQYSYAWTPATPLSDATLPNPILEITESTTFNVLRLPINQTPGCPAKDTVFVSFDEQPKALFTYEVYANCRGVDAIFTNESENFSKLQWRFSNGEVSVDLNPNEIFTFNDSLITTLVATNGACRDSITLSEYIKDFNDYFKDNNSNAFSPNGDGVNDCFNPALQLSPPPYDRAFLECTDLFVYNRWGELVHTSENSNEACWDGKSLKGEDLPEGVYFYRFSSQGKERAGTVHLRRTDL
jgi:gliding motility-associated-like protein